MYWCTDTQPLVTLAFCSEEFVLCHTVLEAHVSNICVTQCSVRSTCIAIVETISKLIVVRDIFHRGLNRFCPKNLNCPRKLAPFLKLLPRNRSYPNSKRGCTIPVSGSYTPYKQAYCGQRGRQVHEAFVWKYFLTREALWHLRRETYSIKLTLNRLVLAGKYKSTPLKMVWNENKEPKYWCYLNSWSNKFCVRYKRGRWPAMLTSERWSAAKFSNKFYAQAV